MGGQTLTQSVPSPWTSHLTLMAPMGTQWPCDVSFMSDPSAPQNKGPSAFSVSCSWARWPARLWTAPSPAPTLSTLTGSAVQCAEVSGTSHPSCKAPEWALALTAPVSSAPADCNYEGRKVGNGQVFTLDDEPCTQCICQVSWAWGPWTCRARGCF